MATPKRTEEEIRRHVKGCLKNLGIALVTAEYEGGHDEGGIHLLDYFTERGNRLGLGDVDPELNDMVVDLLWQYLGEKYGNFAGEFSAWGNISLDLEKNTLCMDGTEIIEEFISVSEKWEL